MYLLLLSPRLLSALAALFVSALIISVIFAIIPLCTNVLLLAIAMAVSGLAMGIIDTIANIQLVTIYQRDSAVFLQVKNLFLSTHLHLSNNIDPHTLPTGVFLRITVSLPFCIFAGSPLLHRIRSLGEPTDCGSLPLGDGLREPHRERD